MARNDITASCEKENMLRYLLATVLFSTKKSQLAGSHSRWGSFWQGLLKKKLMHQDPLT